MESDVKPDINAEVEQVRVDINPEDSGSLAPISTVEQSEEQWQQFGERVSLFLSELPDYLGEFFSEYKRPLVTIGLILGAIVSVKLVLAVLGAVNDIPLLSQSFELIGLGYSFWFVYRYLLRASNRQELSEDFSALKEQVLGRKSVNE